MENPVLKNMGTGQIVEIVKSPFTIGRSLACDYIIEDKIVSRAHFKLNKTDDGWSLIDSSTNGTLVNDNIYKGEPSPALKHNDTISLGYDNYTYRFLTEIDKAPNHQVERLRNEEINISPVPLGSDQNSSPSTPNSFDENGISDDILNHLADNMLDNVEINMDTKENTVSTQENIPNQPTTSCLVNSNIQNINPSSSVKSNESVPSQSNSSTNTIIYSLPDDGLQDNMEVEESSANREHQNNTVTSSGDQNNIASTHSNSVFTLDNILSKPIDRIVISGQNVVKIHDNRDIVSVSMAPIQGTSTTVVPKVAGSNSNSVFTLDNILSKPKDSVVISEQSVVERHDNRDIVGVSMAPIQGTSTTIVPTTSIITAGSTNTGSVINLAPFKPRDLLRESIEAVVRRYSGANDSSANANAITLGQNTIPTITGPSGSVLTTLSLSSTENVNKRIKMVACSPTGSAQRLPTITRLSNSEMQRILASSPQIPIIRLDSLQVRFPTSSNSAGVQNTAATLAGLKTYGSKTIPSTQGNIMTSHTAGAQNTAAPLASLKTYGKKTVPSTQGTVTTSIQSSNVDNSSLVTVTASDSILRTRLGTTNAVADSTVEVVDFTALPVGQEVTIENTTDIAEITNNLNTNQVVASTVHESQEAGPCKVPEKVPNIDLKQANQNQFEEMENEMMCTICANLFIKAVTLGCSHTFCHYCIEQWKKKKSDCPICRNKIASSTRTLVLDNIIEKMLEGVSEEEKQDRKSSLEERIKLEEEEKAKLAQQSTNKSARGRGGRGGRGNNGNYRGNQRNNNAGNNRPEAPNVITIPDSPSPSTTDSDDDNDSNGSYDDDNEDDWYNNRPYYGGYGRCYSCGDRGHWANGCPYR